MMPARQMLSDLTRHGEHVAVATPPGEGVAYFPCSRYTPSRNKMGYSDIDKVSHLLVVVMGRP